MVNLEQLIQLQKDIGRDCIVSVRPGEFNRCIEVLVAVEVDNETYNAMVSIERDEYLRRGQHLIKLRLEMLRRSFDEIQTKPGE